MSILIRFHKSVRKSETRGKYGEDKRRRLENNGHFVERHAALRVLFSDA